ncbi:Transposase IS116/IS110/IS902 family protein [compost metagenome]
MKNWNVILGVDVSKLTLDICCAERNLHLKIENQSKGFRMFKTWCKTNGINLKETLVVMEFTGGYEHRFIQFCESQSIAYCRLPGLEIKNSMGMVRGKNDQVDAFRIGRYGEEKIKRLAPSKPLNKDFFILRQLLSFRKRLVRENAGLKSTLKERKHMYDATKTDPIVRIIQPKLKANKQYIRELEMEIMDIVKRNEQMKENYKIITSIRGIGPVNACMTIAYTENFTSFADARKYAVYVGVIPFGRTSGTSIKGKPKVSHLAHKELKQELNQAAKTAMTHDPELRAYGERKQKTKCYNLVLNNVKFKLILRMFSLVKRGEIYVENYQRAC